MTPAQKVQRDIKHYAEDRGWRYTKIVASSRNGDPDIQLVICSDTYYVEVKTPNDRLRPNQIITLNILNKNRKVCFVVKSLKDFVEQFKEVESFYGETVKINLTNSFKNVIKSRIPNGNVN